MVIDTAAVVRGVQAGARTVAGDLPVETETEEPVAPPTDGPVPPDEDVVVAEPESA